MAGKHSAPKTGSKAPIIIVTAVVLAAAIAAAVIFFVVPSLSKDGDSQSTAAQPTETSAQPSAPTAAQPQTTEAETAALNTHPEETVPDIFIPTEAGSTITHFNATFIPNGEATDMSTDQIVTLREVFGESFAAGTLTFNEDGTFRDTLNGSADAATGRYNVENDIIKAIYSNDRYMNITVEQWNEDQTVPQEFYVIYGEPETGYRVYFSEN